MVTTSDGNTHDPPRILMLEPDQSLARRSLDALGQRPAASVAPQLDDSRSAAAHASRNCWILNSLDDLHAFDLDHIDLVICEMNLPDGYGLDALAYCRGMRPELPMILVGESPDVALAVECIRAGAVDFVLKTANYFPALALAMEKCLAHQRIKRENERLQRDLSRSLSELAEKNGQLQHMIRQLESMARTDELTGLCNRRWLNETLERVWAEAIRNSRPLAFLMIDLDGFKPLNDELGHLRGDAMLKLTSRVIAANCREVDVAARYGGDEFCILMPHTETHEAIRVAERILREFLYAQRDAAPSTPRVGMSMGVAQVEHSRPATAEQLIGHADEAMYAAKTAGFNRIMVRRADGIIGSNADEPTNHDAPR